MQQYETKPTMSALRTCGFSAQHEGAASAVLKTSMHKEGELTSEQAWDPVAVHQASLLTELLLRY